MTNSNWTRINTRDEYLAQCADRYYGEDAGQSIAMRNGQIYGDFGGQRLHGTWEWTDGFFSRTSKLGDLDLGHDNIVIEINDTQMRLTMNEGNGDQVVYDAKPAPATDSVRAGETAVCSTFNIKPEGVDAFVEAMSDNQQHVRAEPGNIEMRMFQEVHNPSAFYLFGRSAPGSDDAHSADVADRGIEERVAPTINTPPVVRMLGTTNQGTNFGPRDRGVTNEELIVIALFEFKPGYRDRVLAQYDKQIPIVRAQPNSILFNVFTIDGEPDKIVVYERWVSEEIGMAFQNEPVSIETGNVLTEAIVGDLQSYIRPLREIEPYFHA